MVEKKYLDFCKFYAKFGLLLKQRNVYKGFLLVWKYHTLQKFCKTCINYLMIGKIKITMVIVNQYVNTRKRQFLNHTYKYMVS